MAICHLCRKEFKKISSTHLARVHPNWTLISYAKKFGATDVGFPTTISSLHSTDPRYVRWRESLKKRPTVWSKGYTKETHPSIAKISATMQSRKIDNFRAWREQMIRSGKILDTYLEFPPSSDLAEYIGVVLGDGHITRFPRTEQIIISCNSGNRGFIKRYAELSQELFGKTPVTYKVPNRNNVRIWIYQKEISRRLGIPSGSRRWANIVMPSWIWDKDEYLASLLKGLFEAEGSLNIHLPTHNNFAFSNRNQSLLDIVKDALIKLGYHPEVRYNAIRLRKRHEVERFRRLIRFREY